MSKSMVVFCAALIIFSLFCKMSTMAACVLCNMVNVKQSKLLKASRSRERARVATNTNKIYEFCNFLDAEDMLKYLKPTFTNILSSAKC